MRQPGHTAFDGRLGHRSEALPDLPPGPDNFNWHELRQAIGRHHGLRRWIRIQWHCLKRTGWAHEIDLHSGVCRYCGAPVKDEPTQQT